MARRRFVGRKGSLKIRIGAFRLLTAAVGKRIGRRGFAGGIAVERPVVCVFVRKQMGSDGECLVKRFAQRLIGGGIVVGAGGFQELGVGAFDGARIAGGLDLQDLPAVHKGLSVERAGSLKKAFRLPWG